MGGEDDASKAAKKSKKSKRVANLASEVAIAVASTSAPPSGDSHDDRGSPVVHNPPVVSGDAEPLPPVIAAA